MERKGVVGACECQNNKWISVNERLPEEFESVLIIIMDENSPKVVKEGFITPNGFMIPGCLEFVPNVTHWMPMPEPPNEANDAGTS